MTKEQRYQRNAELFSEELENLLLSRGYYEGCYEHFYSLIKADIKPSQKAKMKDFNKWAKEQ